MCLWKSRSRQTVDRDCEILRHDWRARASIDYDALAADQFEHLSSVRSEAWRCFEQSKSESRPEGNPRFLQIVLRATAEIRKLMGLEDRIKFESRRVTDEEGADGHIDIVEVVADDRGATPTIRQTIRPQFGR